MFNAFNHEGYNEWFGGADGDFPENFGKPANALAGATRSIKFGVNWNW